MRQNQIVIAEAHEEAESLREQIHKICDELQRIESEKKVLVLQGTPAVPVDLGQAVEAMREDFAAMFDDSSLPSTASSKKDEVEAGFLTMRNLVGMLSAISQEYKAAKQQATSNSD